MSVHLSLHVPMLSQPTPKSHLLTRSLTIGAHTHPVVLQEHRTEEEASTGDGWVREFLGPKCLEHGLEGRWVLCGHVPWPRTLEWESLEQSAAGRGPDCLGLRAGFWVLQVRDILA